MTLTAVSYERLVAVSLPVRYDSSGGLFTYEVRLIFHPFLHRRQSSR